MERVLKGDCEGVARGGSGRAIERPGYNHPHRHNSSTFLRFLSGSYWSVTQVQQVIYIPTQGTPYRNLNSLAFTESSRAVVQTLSRSSPRKLNLFFSLSLSQDSAGHMTQRDFEFRNGLLYCLGSKRKIKEMKSSILRKFLTLFYVLLFLDQLCI